MLSIVVGLVDGCPGWVVLDTYGGGPVLSQVRQKAVSVKMSKARARIRKTRRSLDVPRCVGILCPLGIIMEEIIVMELFGEQ